MGGVHHAALWPAGAAFADGLGAPSCAACFPLHPLASEPCAPECLFTPSGHGPPHAFRSLAPSPSSEDGAWQVGGEQWVVVVLALATVQPHAAQYSPEHLRDVADLRGVAPSLTAANSLVVSEGTVRAVHPGGEAGSRLAWTARLLSLSALNAAVMSGVHVFWHVAPSQVALVGLELARLRRHAVRTAVVVDLARGAGRQALRQLRDLHAGVVDRDSKGRAVGVPRVVVDVVMVREEGGALRTVPLHHHNKHAAPAAGATTDEALWIADLLARAQQIVDHHHRRMLLFPSDAGGGGGGGDTCAGCVQPEGAHGLPFVENSAFWSDGDFVRCDAACLPNQPDASVPCMPQCVFTRSGRGPPPLHSLVPLVAAHPQAVGPMRAASSRPQWVVVAYGPPACGKGSAKDMLARLHPWTGIGAADSAVEVQVDRVFQNSMGYANGARDFEALADSVLQGVGRERRGRACARLYRLFRWTADQISDALLDLALMEGRNVVWETTGADVGWARREIARWRAHGVRVALLFPVATTRDMLVRKAERERHSGQIAASASQVVANSVAALRNVAGLLPREFQQPVQAGEGADLLVLVDNTRSREERQAVFSAFGGGLCEDGVAADSAADKRGCELAQQRAGGAEARRRCNDFVDRLAASLAAQRAEVEQIVRAEARATGETLSPLVEGLLTDPTTASETPLRSLCGLL